MGINVTVNLDSMKRKLTTGNIDRALFALTSQAQADMTLYTPKKEGHLRDDSFAEKNHISYKAPYAKVQFRGLVVTKSGRIVRIRHYTTPGTSRRWDLRAKANHMNSWKKAFLDGGKF